MNPNVICATYPLDDEYLASDDDQKFFAPCEHSFLRLVEPPPAVDAWQYEYTDCPITIDTQIVSLAQLDNGWYDEESRAYRPEELRWAANLLGSVLDAFALPIPYVYPTPDGLVRAEWSSGNAEVIVNINLSNQSAEAIAALVGSDDIEELPVSFADYNAERVLGLFLSRYLIR